MNKDNKKYHDPSEYIRNLQQLLVSDKKKIGFLFGAGTSLVKNPTTKESYIPAIRKMTEIIETELTKEGKYKKPIEEIKKEIEEDQKVYTIETLLTKLELKKKVIGNGKINDLDKKEIKSLIESIKEKIHNLVGIQDNVEAKKLVHSTFAEWIKKANRKSAIEIFTTNYDFLFEVAFEYHALSYYDGFTGSYQPFFDGEAVDDLSFLPNQTKLWKIHGSLGWHYDETLKRVLRKSPDSKDILIYPSTLKYDHSRKQPYTALGDRLTNFIKQPDSILIVCGYSLGDEHINERINTALLENPLGHVYVLLYDKEWDENEKKYCYCLTEDSDMAKIAISNCQLSVFGMRSAVIGGVYGIWRLKREPDKDDSISIDTYYDEDAYSNDEDEKNKELKQSWTGEGELILPDFEKFVKFLQCMIFPNINENKI
jgi:hypothetical protein